MSHSVDCNVNINFSSLKTCYVFRFCMFALRRLLTTRRPIMLSTSQKIDELLKFVSTLSHSTSISAESKHSDDDDRFYITTAINYTNGLPHIGHAYEAVTSDVIARYHRIYGRKVWFLTGTDEHGQKVEGNFRCTFSVHSNHSEF